MDNKIVAHPIHVGTLVYKILSWCLTQTTNGPITHLAIYVITKGHVTDLLSKYMYNILYGLVILLVVMLIVVARRWTTNIKGIVY